LQLVGLGGLEPPTSRLSGVFGGVQGRPEPPVFVGIMRNRARAVKMGPGRDSGFVLPLVLPLDTGDPAPASVRKMEAVLRFAWRWRLAPPDRWCLPVRDAGRPRRHADGAKRRTGCGRNSPRQQRLPEAPAGEGHAETAVGSGGGGGHGGFFCRREPCGNGHGGLIVVGSGADQRRVRAATGTSTKSFKPPRRLLVLGKGSQCGLDLFAGSRSAEFTREYCIDVVDQVRGSRLSRGWIQR
jgi:hypothetical protein